MKWLKEHSRKISFVVLSLLIALTVMVSGVNITVHPVDGLKVLTIGKNQVTLMIGTASATGATDYTCNGLNDSATFQTAINALPATGGKLEVLGGSYIFTATVTRAINNITIEGVGQGTSFTYDGVTPIFTAGGNNWVMRDFDTDAGDVSFGATTGWVRENVNGNSLNSPSVTVRSLTSGRVPIAGTSGLLGDDADLTFTGGNTLNLAGTFTMTSGTFKFFSGTTEFLHANPNYVAGTIGSAGTNDVQLEGQTDYVRTAIDLFPTVGVFPAQYAYTELVLYHTRRTDADYERFNFSSISANTTNDYRFGMEKNGTGNFLDVNWTHENLGGKEVFLQFDATPVGDSWPVALQYGHLRFDVASMGGTANTYFIGRGGGTTFGLNVPTGGGIHFWANNADMGVFDGGGLTLVNGLQAQNTDATSLVLRARDSGVGEVEVARLQGAADPYFAIGGSEQYKFYNSGANYYGGLKSGVNQGAAGAAANELWVDTSDNGTVKRGV